MTGGAAIGFDWCKEGRMTAPFLGHSTLTPTAHQAKLRGSSLQAWLWP